jgi:NADP-dependent 3-hydroxy acid dehydrogenase YdfG
MKIFITGGHSGIGQATKNLLIQQGHDVVAPTRGEFDLTNFEQIDSLDLSSYDVVVNCAGVNSGAYLGWHNNTWQNQSNHVAVNFTGPLFLAKQYTRQRQQGQFVYVTSASADDPISYTIFMVGSKLALRHSLEAVKRDYPGILFTEIVPGKTQTNMLRQNYQGSRTEQQIAEEYARSSVLDSQQVAQTIGLAIELGLYRVGISPRPHKQNN